MPLPDQLKWVGTGWVGEAAGVPVAFFLSIMATTRLQLPCPVSAPLPLGPAAVCVSSVPGAADSLLCSLTLAAAVSPGARI